jgi:hypothetical protein
MLSGGKARFARHCIPVIRICLFIGNRTREKPLGEKMKQKTLDRVAATLASRADWQGPAVPLADAQLRLNARVVNIR